MLSLSVFEFQCIYLVLLSTPFILMFRINIFLRCVNSAYYLAAFCFLSLMHML
jgi:hypothetical protein